MELLTKTWWQRIWCSLPSLTHLRTKKCQQTVCFIFLYPWAAFLYAFHYIRILCSYQWCRISHVGSWGVWWKLGVCTWNWLEVSFLSVASHVGNIWTWVWRRGSFGDSYILITSVRFTEMLRELLICLNRKGVTTVKAAWSSRNKYQGAEIKQISWGVLGTML